MKIQMLVMATFAFGLAACSGGETKSDEMASDANKAVNRPATPPSGSATPAATLAQGPDVCFKAIAKQIGADTKVAEIASFFSSGPEVDPSDDEPTGQMTTCTVQYQSPDDPRKLVGIQMDMKTGTFSEPAPIEIRVMGDAASFRLDDHIVPLSQVQAGALTAIMNAKKADLDKVFSKYAWTGVRLMGPDSFRDKHTLRLDVEGRIAANDIKESGYASISLDGQKIVTDNLAP